MSEGLNRVTLIGNLGADPELRYTQGGGAVLNLRLATSESYFDKASNERKERVEWHSVVLWGKRAEALNSILSKGRSICIEGRIQYRSWEDKNGAKRISTDIVATNVVLLGGRREGGSGGLSGGPGKGPLPGGGHGYGGGQAESFPADDFGDDDIPFLTCDACDGARLLRNRWDRG